jgi:hypothetical protein
MKTLRLSGEKPKCTILESFDGKIVVIGPNFVKSIHREMKDAFNFIDRSYWQINISHLHGPYGMKQREEKYHGSDIKGSA